MKITISPEQAIAAHAEWLVDRWFAYVGTTAGFDWFWAYIASQVTVAALRGAARVLKIDRPAKTRPGLREQFAAKWSEVS